MKLLHFTDIHLTTPGDTIADRDPNANFEAALDHALARHADAEALIVTGDLSDWGDREDYVRLRDRLARLPMPAHLCVGNHDDPAAFLTVFPELADENGFVQHAFALSRGTGLALDTTAPRTHAGAFCAARAAWLEARLSEGDGPFWLFLHHNPVPTGVPPCDEIMLLDAERLGEVVARHADRIAHIFFGHCHQPLCGSFHGVPFSAPRGTNHAGFANFGETRKLTRSELPEAYGVVLASDAQVMVHMIEFKAEADLAAEGSPNWADWTRGEMAR
ncbi:MAG: metallophosphoesterase [Pseudomonadota bacterium]